MAECHEKCGVFGIFAPGWEVARVTHAGLWSLQHRGQEGTGIAVSDGERLSIHKNLGLVTQVYTDADLDRLKGHIAIGHNRYSTHGGSTLEHVQPVFRYGRHIALAHNGNLPDTSKLEKFLHSVGVSTAESNDSEMIADAINYSVVKGLSLEQAVRRVYPLCVGAFAIVVMTKDRLIAFRDRCGVRPLVMGRMEARIGEKVSADAIVFASESCVFPIIGAKVEREVLPGEMVVVDQSGVRSMQLVKGRQRFDLFEFVYFARADSMFLGKRVNEVRREFGRQLARESKPLDGNVDVVVAVPDSAFPAAEGFAQESGIVLQNGFIKNGYVHRTFIRPEQHSREAHLHMKLNPIPEVLAGKSVILIDDSIVRGTTTRQLVRLIRSAGAKEVHVRISSAPVRYPDFYGIDTPSQKELIAAVKSTEEICAYIGADSLTFLSYDGMIRATGLPERVLCTSCFTGKYPVPIGKWADGMR